MNLVIIVLDIDVSFPPDTIKSLFVLICVDKIMNSKNTYRRMKYTKVLILLVTVFGMIVFGTEPVCSQNQKPKMKRSKVLSILKRANVEYENGRFAVAAKDFEDYLSIDTTYPKGPLSKLADCYWQLRANNNAFRVYKLLFRNGKESASVDQKVRVGELYARYGMYKQAAEWLQDVGGYKEKAIVYNRRSKLELLKRDSLCWNLGFLNINSFYRDYSPVLVDSTLFFSSNQPLSVKKQISPWDDQAYTRLRKISLRKVKTEPVSMGKPTSVFKRSKTEVFTTETLAPVHEGADVKNIQTEINFMYGIQYVQNRDTTSSVVDGLEKIDFNITGLAYDYDSHVYFSANYPKKKNKISRTCLMEGLYSINEIINVRVLPFGNPKSYSVMLPAVSSNGNVLVFCSDKSGGKGKMDLYYVVRDSLTHKWGAIKTFQGDLNTVGNDVFPSITPDGYLYFSSDARPGLGGLDIYRILLKEAMQGTGNLVHLSYPVNSSGDDFGLTVDATGANGFFSSDRLNNGDDLYSFYYKACNRERFIYGSVLNELTKEPIMDATIFLLNQSTGEVSIARTSGTGKYTFSVNSGDRVVVKAMKKGMSNDFLVDDPIKMTELSDTITREVQDLLLDKQADSETDFVEAQKDDLTTVDRAFLDIDDEQVNDSTIQAIQHRMFTKQNFKINNSWKLNNIYYDFASADIREESKPMLDSLIAILKKSPLVVEICSHTDSRGTFEYNDLLSQKRAESVVTYLVKHGIAGNRLLAKGFGKRRLLITCGGNIPCTERNHQLNRRTEVRVMGYSHKEKKYKFDPSKYKEGEVIDKLTLPKDFFDN